MKAGDAITFEEIGFMPSNPDAHGAGSYMLQHPDYARNAINYYRLRQLDSNGTNHYHRVIEVRPGQSGDVLAPVLFPNPFQNVITIRFKTLSTEAGSVELFDLQGRQVFQSDWAKDQQPEDMTIETERFAPGVYVYRIVAGGKVFSGKVVRE